MRALEGKFKSTQKQRAFIHVLAREAGADVKAVCAQHTDGKAKAIADLSKKEAAKVIEFLLEQKKEKKAA